MPRPHFPRFASCAYCEHALGEDEPIVLILPGEGARVTSLAEEPDPPSDGVAMHESCYRENAPI